MLTFVASHIDMHEAMENNDFTLRIESNRQSISQAYYATINQSNLELYGRMKHHLEELKEIYPLIEFVLERLVTVTELVDKNMIWDAEIIHRTALETLLKLIFITSADKEEQVRRIDEYWNQLPEVASMAISEQAKKNLILTGNLELHRLAYSPLVLSAEEEIRLRAKWSKRDRKSLEQKWSFTGMVSALTENYRGQQINMFIQLLHGYKMSSHVSHGDEIGLSMINERRARPQQDEAIADFAHIIRLMSDCCSHCIFIGVETMLFVGQNPKYFIDLNESLTEIQAFATRCQMELYEDPFYDPYR